MRLPARAAVSALFLVVLMNCAVPSCAGSPKRRSALLSSHRQEGKIILDEAAIASTAEHEETQQLDAAYYAGSMALGRAIRTVQELLNTSSNSTVSQHVKKDNSTRPIDGKQNATVAFHTQKGNLTAELDNLKAVYESLNKGIVRGNKHEHQGVEEDAKNIETVDARIKAGELELNSTNISAFRREMIVNRTRSDVVELKYWKQHRDSSHGVFHAHLKMAHGMMDRIKEVTEVYEAVLAGGKVDKNKLNQKLKQASWGLPSKKPIAFPQQSSEQSKQSPEISPASMEPAASKPLKATGVPTGEAPVKR